MNFEHFLAQPFIVILHVIAAIAAIIIGFLQISFKKRTTAHRIVGYVWVIIMAGIAISSFFINEIRIWGAFSPIHILSIIVLFSLYHSIKAAKSSNFKRHRQIMRQLFFFALPITGAFTLLPGRVMNVVIFGG